MAHGTRTATARLILDAATAAELMADNPRSIRDTATVAEALTFLTDRGFGVAPVVDEAGKPVGVLSGTDLLVHERERLNSAHPSAPAAGTEPVCVRDLMTPAVFSVRPDTPAEQVVEQMLAFQVHHLFVVDPDGTLRGVIGALDIVRRLRAG